VGLDVSGPLWERVSILAERLRVLEQQLQEVRTDVEELTQEVSNYGRGGRPSLRRRLHNVEGTLAGMEKLAKARTEEQTQRFTRREKTVALLVAALALGPPYALLVLTVVGR
jgi:regulator of replication initiation timing